MFWGVLEFFVFSQGWGGGCVSSPLGGAEAPGNGEMKICHFWDGSKCLPCVPAARVSVAVLHPKHKILPFQKGHSSGFHDSCVRYFD